MDRRIGVRREAKMQQMTEDLQKPAKHRLQFEFAPDAYDRLHSLKEQSRAASFAEVVRSALRLYDWYMTKRREGYSIALIKENEPIKEVELVF